MALGACPRRWSHGVQLTPKPQVSAEPLTALLGGVSGRGQRSLSVVSAPHSAHDHVRACGGRSRALADTPARRRISAAVGPFPSRPLPEDRPPRCTWGDGPGTSRREGATFAAPSRHALESARQTLGPAGVREMSSTMWAKSFSLPSIAMSACARTPTSVLSSSTTGKRRT